ncbi:prolyl oligopeptidase family serine peptidase [Sphingomonas sp. LT1P40]|uniref:prolyl oligopeptidase family serine peptidase n=1 Tax=Alteristakelama amylovorans TaxID=3096166 RepID=UPI002FC8E65B
MRRASLIALPLLFAAPFANANPESPTTMPAPITYPETKRGDVVEDQFGTKVADPYRWLEDDVRNNPEVAAWVAAQNKVTDAYLATLPGRDVFRSRLKALFDYERFGAPYKKGGRYFYFRNSGLQNQAVLYVRDSVNGEGRVLIDPNTWAKDGATALAEWSPSEDGTRLAYGVQDGGTDWRTVRVLDVNTGAVLADEIKWAKFTGISWAKDGSGFFYARFPEPKEGTAFQAGADNHAVYFHKLGTPQSADRLLYSTPENPKLLNGVGITDDGRYAVLYSTPGSSTSDLSVIDLKSADWKPRKLVTGFDHEWGVVGNVGTKFFISTNKDAARSKLMTLDIAAATPTMTDLIPEGEAVLNSASLVGGRLILSYLVDAKTEVRRYTLDGKADGTVKLPGIGTAGGFGGDAKDSETFFTFTSFNAPSTVYRYDVATNTASVWAAPKVAIDLSNIVVEQKFYASKDGTKVPMFIVRRKDVTGPAPTLLYAYGGFNVTQLPSFSTSRLAWVEQGGVFVLANIRGGGEYGKAWHDGGRLLNKQNVFDDFIAAGEYLKAQGITSKDGLAIQGGSNGGLLVGAVVNQRPDLFAAGLPAVGVMDMLRFDKFTAGRYWTNDYGVPAKEADFKNLYKYSPYHNIQAGKTYPAILATTADTDDRVVPGHTFKYTAALQAADVGPKPHLVRIETRAGHGSGKPTDKIIEETADLWAFAAKWTGLAVTPVK